MSVELDPPELGFRRPFTQEVSQVLRLHNPNSDPVAFKVKTTAPKQYCVRPNSGRIDSGRDVEVQVLLQAMKEDPPPDARCRDKFLVQSVAVSPDSDAANVNQIWSNIEQNAKSSIQERKIRVTFLPADGGATTNGVAAAGAGAAGGLAAGGAAAAAYSTSRADEPPAYASNTPAVTPQKPQDNSNFAETPAGDSSLPSQSAARAMTSNATTTDPDTNSSTTSAIPAAIPQNQEDLKAQLDEAKKTIQQLQTQAQEGLRQRKPQEAMESAKQTLQQASEQAPGGVSVQITAILCLVCFLIAWLFF